MYISILLCEEVLILQLNEKKGKFPLNSGMYLRRVIPTAISEELRLLGKIHLESEGKNAYLVLLDDTPTNEPLLDGVLNEIAQIARTQGNLNLVGYLRSVSDKKKTIKRWLDPLWEDLERKGIIREQKGKHFFVDIGVKDRLFKEVKDICARKAQPNEHQKSLISFFRWTRSLRFLCKGVSRDKEWIKSFCADRLIPKIFARYVFMPALIKQTKTIVGAGAAVGSSVQSASARASAGMSAAGANFAKVQGIGSTRQASWGGLEHEKAPQEGTIKKVKSIGGSPGDAILKGVKKIAQKVKDRDKGPKTVKKVKDREKGPKICTSCGKEMVDSKIKFCKHCGAYVK